MKEEREREGGEKEGRKRERGTGGRERAIRIKEI